LPERIAQLMGKHRQKLVFAAVRFLTFALDQLFGRDVASDFRCTDNPT
jgi:hypothetical protein